MHYTNLTQGMDSRSWLLLATTFIGGILAGGALFAIQHPLADVSPFGGTHLAATEEQEDLFDTTSACPAPTDDRPFRCVCRCGTRRLHVVATYEAEEDMEEDCPTWEEGEECWPDRDVIPYSLPDYTDCRTEERMGGDPGESIYRVIDSDIGIETL